MKFKSDKQRKAVMSKLRKKGLIKPPFKKANVLPVQISTIVPSTKKDRKISNSLFQKRVNSEKRWFDSHFGGDTTVRTVGSYLMGKKLIKEKGALIESSTTIDKYNRNRGKLADHIKKRIKDWKQDSIFLKIEGVSFIYPKKDYIDHDKKFKRLIQVT